MRNRNRLKLILFAAALLLSSRVLFATPGRNLGGETTASVPEPSTYSTFGIGFLALGALSRRRKGG